MGNDPATWKEEEHFERCQEQATEEIWDDCRDPHFTETLVEDFLKEKAEETLVKIMNLIAQSKKEMWDTSRMHSIHTEERKRWIRQEQSALGEKIATVIEHALEKYVDIKAEEIYDDN